MEDCLFCKIVNKQIPGDVVYEDETCLAFNDISPQAPVHILVVPKEHIASANDVSEENSALVGHIIAVCAHIAKEKGFSQDGYRIINNCGENAGQTVKHLHFHILAGKNMGEKLV